MTTISEHICNELRLEIGRRFPGTRVAFTDSDFESVWLSKGDFLIISPEIGLHEMDDLEKWLVGRQGRPNLRAVQTNERKAATT